MIWASVLQDIVSFSLIMVHIQSMCFMMQPVIIQQHKIVEKDGSLKGHLIILLLQAEVCSYRHSKAKKLQTLQVHIPGLYYLEGKRKPEECFLQCLIGYFPQFTQSYLSTTPAIQCCLLLNSSFYIFENISIQSSLVIISHHHLIIISLLFASLHSLLQSIFSYRLVLFLQISDQFCFACWPFFT